MTDLSSPAPTAPPKRPFIRTPMALAGQALLLVAVLLAAWGMGQNLDTNLARRSLTFGFAYLMEPAGFDLSETLLPFTGSQNVLTAYAAGISNTLRVAFAAMVLTTILGTLLGIARLAQSPTIRLLASIYVDVVRNIPVLVHVLIWYFCLSNLLPLASDQVQPLPGLYLSKEGLSIPVPIAGAGWGLFGGFVFIGLLAAWAVRRATGRFLPAAALFLGSILAAVAVPMLLGMPPKVAYPQMGKFTIVGGAVLSPEYMALLGALSMAASAYMAEIVRAGILSVQKGQWEAAAAIGLNRNQLLRFVVLPLSLRVIIPPYISLCLNITKNSSLAVAIGYPDLVSVTNTVMNQNGRAVEGITVLASVYLSLSLLTSLIMNAYNRRWALRER
ncbi:amino acid ABC transporter permease [Elstera sp.]|uniref:amino acid ABC transporter permease n=1 Tax=Elstera sp. TaxID=1916664 RepID=UPI0037C098DC